MCMACDGISEEKIAQWLEMTILTNGWALQGVEPPDPSNPAGGWLYTVGATESFGLPELVIADRPIDEAGHVLNWAVQLLRDGGSLDDLDADHVLWVPVHDEHLPTDLFASYTNHYGEPPRTGQMIQLFASTREHSAECIKDSSTNLSDPSQRPDDSWPY